MEEGVEGVDGNELKNPTGAGGWESQGLLETGEKSCKEKNWVNRTRPPPPAFLTGLFPPHSHS